MKHIPLSFLTASESESSVSNQMRQQDQRHMGESSPHQDGRRPGMALSLRERIPYVHNEANWRNSWVFSWVEQLMLPCKSNYKPELVSVQSSPRYPDNHRCPWPCPRQPLSFALGFRYKTWVIHKFFSLSVFQEEKITLKKSPTVRWELEKWVHQVPVSRTPGWAGAPNFFILGPSRWQ